MLRFRKPKSFRNKTSLTVTTCRHNCAPIWLSAETGSVKRGRFTGNFFFVNLQDKKAACLFRFCRAVPQPARRNSRDDGRGPRRRRKLQHANVKQTQKARKEASCNCKAAAAFASNAELSFRFSSCFQQLRRPLIRSAVFVVPTNAARMDKFSSTCCFRSAQTSFCRRVDESRDSDRLPEIQRGRSSTHNTFALAIGDFLYQREEIDTFSAQRMCRLLDGRVTL